MSNKNVTKFHMIPNNTAFSPAAGEVGSQFVYVKKVNGVCPKLGSKNEEGIFFPNDRVVQVQVPAAMLKQYQFD